MRFIDRLLGKDTSIDNMTDSGVYVVINGVAKDMVYDTSDEYFLGWLRDRGMRIEVAENVDRVSPHARYQFLKRFEQNGGVFHRSQKWQAFEERMSSIMSEYTVRPSTN